MSYQLVYNRTLADNRSIIIFILKHNMDKVTHTYTTQYVFTNNLLQVFVYKNYLETLALNWMNSKWIYTVVLKSCNNLYKIWKIRTKLFIDFLSCYWTVLFWKEQFLLVVISWGGQAKVKLYDWIFQEWQEVIVIRKLKMIPQKVNTLVNFVRYIYIYIFITK